MGVLQWVSHRTAKVSERLNTSVVDYYSLLTSQITTEVAKKFTMDDDRAPLYSDVEEKPMADDDRARLEEWTYTLCGCFANTEICLIGWLLPCVLYGRVAESSKCGEFLTCCLVFGAATTCYSGLAASPLPPVYAKIVGLVTAGVSHLVRSTLLCRQRIHIRHRESLRGDDCTDCLVSWFRAPCVLCQHAGQYKDLPTSYKIERT